MKRTRVLVVGAGPAGASSAFFLKNFDLNDNFDVDLVDILKDKDYFNYHAICGEAISSQAFKELDPLKPAYVKERIRFIDEFYPGGAHIRVKAKGFVIDRPKFLSALLKKYKNLNGKFAIRKVVGVANGKDRVRVQFLGHGQKDYDYVIAADGPTSLIRWSMGLSNAKAKAYVQFTIDKEPEHGVLKFYYDESFLGDYKWEFPNGKTTKIGYPLISGQVPKLEVEGEIVSRKARCIAAGRMSKYSQGRVLFVGDAAYQTNPLTKGGLRSGMNAAKMAAHAVYAGDIRSYGRIWTGSGFSSQVFSEAYDMFAKMDNVSLGKLSEELQKEKACKENIKIVQAIELSEKYGW